MRSLTSIRAAVLASLVSTCLAKSCKTGCGNNCARAVIAGAFPERPTKADCSSFLAVTTTPPVVTFTVTASQVNTEIVTELELTTETILTTQTDISTAIVTTVETITAAAPAPVKRQATDNGIPSYATACKSSAAYSKACSCIGVSAYTTEAPTPSTTVTVFASSILTETTVTTQTDYTTATDVVSTVTTSVETITTTLPPPGPTAVLRNGDFEEADLGWAFSVLGPGFSYIRTDEDGRVFSGDYAMRLARTASPTANSHITLAQRVNVVSGRTYNLRYTVMNVGAANCWTYAFFTTSLLSIPQPDAFHGQTPPFYAFDGQDMWKTNSRTFTVAPGVSSGVVAVRLYCDSSPAVSFWVDYVVLEEVN